jgi:PAS domain S-box-containing protein
MEKKISATDGHHLWRLAEKVLVATPDGDGNLSGKSPADMASLIHALRVHQIELEMQNEELRRIYDELGKTKDRYSHLYDFAPIGYLTVTEKGIIKEANLTLASMLGVARGALTGKLLSHFVLKDDQDILYQHRRRLMATDESQKCELRLVKKDGRAFFTRWECIPIKTKQNDSKEILAAVSDISESKQAELERDKLKSQLFQSQKLESIGTLAGGIAHEINNILSIILGNNELLMLDLLKWGHSTEKAEAISVASLRARDIVQQLLLFSRQTEVKKVLLQIGSVVKESMQLIRSSTPSNIDIKLDIADDVAPIFGNATQINQVLINLCGNAADAMIQTGGTISIALNNAMIDEKSSRRHAAISPGRHVKLMIGDTGHGMDKRTLDRIFDPYFTTKEIGKGTGIGLTVVHGIVEKHNGMISAESVPGKGTVFEILIPAYQGYIEQVPEAETVCPTGYERILFINDDPSLFKLGKQRLEKLGYTVQGFTNPSEALAVFKADPEAFDLIITDLALPHMTGEQLSVGFLKIRPNMPVLICTGYSENISGEKASRLGISSFAVRPLDMADLATVVRKVLDGAKKIT